MLLIRELIEEEYLVFLLHIFIQPVKFQLFLGLILCSAMIF